MSRHSFSVILIDKLSENLFEYLKKINESNSRYLPKFKNHLKVKYSMN